MTERAFIRAVENVADILSSKITLVGHDRDDIRQTVALECLDGVHRFRPEAGTLESFLYVHAKNRLLNRIRAESERLDSIPCRVCHAQARGEGPGHPSGEVCGVYSTWARRNGEKRRLNHPVPLDGISDEHEPRTRALPVAEVDAETAELLLIIDEKLPVELRSDYLKMRAGVKVPKLKRDVVEREVLAILAGVGLAPDDLGYRQQHRAGMRGEPGRLGETPEPVVQHAA